MSDLLKTSLGSGRAVFFLIGVDGPQTLKMFSPRSNGSHSQFERFPIGRETYVCFPVIRADDRGTHAEKKGPLQYVNPRRSGEESERLGEDEMGRSQSTKDKFRRIQSSVHVNLAT